MGPVEDDCRDAGARQHRPLGLTKPKAEPVCYVCSVCFFCFVCYSELMKSASLTPPRAKGAGTKSRAKWLPEVNRLVTQVATLPEKDRRRAAIELVESMNDALRELGLDLQVAVAPSV